MSNFNENATVCKQFCAQKKERMGKPTSFFCVIVLAKISPISSDTSYESRTSSGETFTHDLAVIGGGAGGLSAAKEAAKAGFNVVLFDYVEPSPQGTKWGFAGTCVNVGCIPKKLFHYAASLGRSMSDMKYAGWRGFLKENPSNAYNWSELVQTVGDFVKQLSFSYSVQARKSGIKYINARAKFAKRDDEHEIEYSVKGVLRSVRAKYVIIAVGGRPSFPRIPGIEHAISSDDIFSRKKAPGRTLVVGGGYIAIEVAGFLTGMGYSTTVAVRSTRVLRGFDSQMVEKLVSIMKESGTEFKLGSNVVSLTKREEGSIQVLFLDGSEEVFDTVLMAIGRTPSTERLELPVSVELDSSGKLVTNTNLLVKGTRGIYAVGDCVHGYPELASVAVKGGELLARRLFLNESRSLDLRFIPTTIFTHSEYGSVGLSEERATATGEIEAYLYEWSSLERLAFQREKGSTCLCKLIVKKENGRVIGLHYIGPSAGEVVQGFALAMKLGATKPDFDQLIGVHPTNAEAFVSLSITRSSGESFQAKGGNCGGGKCG